MIRSSRLPALDLLALLHGQLDDFATDLRADLDLEHRLDASVAHDQLGQVAPGDLLGLNADDRLTTFEYRERRQSADHDQEQDKHHDLPAALGAPRFGSAHVVLE